MRAVMDHDARRATKQKEEKERESMEAKMFSSALSSIFFLSLLSYSLGAGKFLPTLCKQGAYDCSAQVLVLRG